MQLSEKTIDFINKNGLIVYQKYDNRSKEVIREVTTEGVSSSFIDPEQFSTFIIEKNGKAIHEFCLSLLHGCCGVGISFHEQTYFSQRGNGYAKLADTLKQLIAKDFNISTLICTITANNEINQKVKKACGWNKLYQFNNNKTDNEVILGVYDLNQSGIICKSEWNVDEEIEMPYGSVRYYQYKSVWGKELLRRRNAELNWFQKFMMKCLRIK